MEKTEIHFLNFTDLDSIEYIYKMYNKYVKEVGFVMKPTIIERAKSKEVIYLTVDEKIVAVCNFHKKRNFLTTIYEIVTDLEYRKKGYGKILIKFLLDRGHVIGLKCPTDNDSNNFYHKIGARLSKTVKGKNRDLNLYIITKKDLI